MIIAHAHTSVINTRNKSRARRRRSFFAHSTVSWRARSQSFEQNVSYFDPSLEAPIRVQRKFAEEAHETLTGLQRYFNNSVREITPLGNSTQVERALQEMRELSIYGST